MLIDGEKCAVHFKRLDAIEIARIGLDISGFEDKRIGKVELVEEWERTVAPFSNLTDHQTQKELKAAGLEHDESLIMSDDAAQSIQDELDKQAKIFNAKLSPLEWSPEELHSLYQTLSSMIVRVDGFLDANDEPLKWTELDDEDQDQLVLTFAPMDCYALIVSAMQKSSIKVEALGK